MKSTFNSLPKPVRQFIPIALLVFVIFFGFSLWYFGKNSGVRVKVREVVFDTDLAITPEAKVKGLLGRSNLPDGKGMLFLFDRKDKYQFHMNGMQFPIDIIWIDDTIITDITKNAPPSTGYPYTLYQPSKPVNRVLEVPAGSADKYGIVPGDGVTFLKK
jgi:uncharacterized protein